MNSAIQFEEVQLSVRSTIRGDMKRGQRLGQDKFACEECLQEAKWWEIAQAALRIMEPVNPCSEFRAAGVHLTNRERELLELAASGLTMIQIANNAGISLRTVTTHLANIYEKMGVNRLHQAVAVASRAGLLEVQPSEQQAPPNFLIDNSRAQRVAAAGLLRLAAEKLVYDDCSDDAAVSEHLNGRD